MCEDGCVMPEAKVKMTQIQWGSVEILFDSWFTSTVFFSPYVAAKREHLDIFSSCSISF